MRRFAQFLESEEPHDRTYTVLHHTHTEEPSGHWHDELTRHGALHLSSEPWTPPGPDGKRFHVHRYALDHSQMSSLDDANRLHQRDPDDPHRWPTRENATFDAMRRTSRSPLSAVREPFLLMHRKTPFQLHVRPD